MEPNERKEIILLVERYVSLVNNTIISAADKIFNKARAESIPLDKLSAIALKGNDWTQEDLAKYGPPAEKTRLISELREYWEVVSAEFLEEHIGLIGQEGHDSKDSFGYLPAYFHKNFLNMLEMLRKGDKEEVGKIEGMSEVQKFLKQTHIPAEDMPPVQRLLRAACDTLKNSKAMDKE